MTSLDLMSRLLQRALVAFGLSTSIQPLVDIRILLALYPKLPRNNELG